MRRTELKNSSRPITRREWATVAAWAFALALVPLGLLWDGYSLAGSDSEYSGFLGGYPNDYNGYLAWIQQALDGQFLFKNLYTSEPHAGVFFHPLFWAIGAVAGATGLPVMLVWYAVHLLSATLMVAAIYRFCALFSDSNATRFLALALATTSSGFGWLVATGAETPFLERPIDTWLAEVNAFQAVITSFFTLPAALALLLMSFAHSILYFRASRIRDALLAGAYALGLAAVHPYDLITLLSVLAVWTLMAGPKYTRGMLIVALMPLPYVVYGLAAMANSAVFSQVNWVMPSATAWAHVVGWGLPLLLCLVAILHPRVRVENRQLGYLVAWLITDWVLISLPLPFQRRMIWGVHVGISLLAAMVLMEFLKDATRSIASDRLRSAVSVVALLAVVFFCAAGSGKLVWIQIERNRAQLFGDYIPTAHLEAFRWLKENRDGAETIVTPPAVAALVPGRTGIAVFTGHWAQTIDAAAKKRFVRSLFRSTGPLDEDSLRKIFERNRVRYVLVGDPSDPGGGIRRRLDSSETLMKVFGNGAVTIWEVRGYQRSSPTRAWRDGNWQAPGSGSL